MFKTTLRLREKNNYLLLISNVLCPLKSFLFLSMTFFLILSCSIKTEADDDALKLYQLCNEYSFSEGKSELLINASDNDLIINSNNSIDFTNANSLETYNFLETSDFIFVFSNFKITSLSKVDLEKLWSFETSGKILSIKIKQDSSESLVIYSKEANHAKKLREKDNIDNKLLEDQGLIKIILSTKTGIPKKETEFVISNQVTLLSELKNTSRYNSLNITKIKGNIVSLLQSNTNKIIWDYKTGGKISDHLDLENELLIGSFDNFLYSLKKKNGSLNWKKRFPDRIAKLYDINPEQVGVMVIGENRIFLINKRNGKNSGNINLSENAVPLKILFDKNFGFYVLTAGRLTLFSDKSANLSTRCNKKTA